MQGWSQKNKNNIPHNIFTQTQTRVCLPGFVLRDGGLYLVGVRVRERLCTWTERWRTGGQSDLIKEFNSKSEVREEDVRDKQLFVFFCFPVVEVLLAQSTRRSRKVKWNMCVWWLVGVSMPLFWNISTSNTDTTTAVLVSYLLIFALIHRPLHLNFVWFISHMHLEKRDVWW